MKPCTNCKEVKPLDLFYDKSGTDGKQSQCKACLAHKQKIRKQNDTRPPKRCSIDGCARPLKARTWCQMHLHRWERNGDPMIVQHDWHTGKTTAHVSYAGAHARVKRAKGPASTYQCQHCNAPAVHWAYNHADPQEMTGTVRPRGVTIPAVYSLSPDFYIPLCQSCHYILDGRFPPKGDRFVTAALFDMR